MIIQTSVEISFCIGELPFSHDILPIIGEKLIKIVFKPYAAVNIVEYIYEPVCVYRRFANPVLYKYPLDAVKASPGKSVIGTVGQRTDPV